MIDAHVHIERGPYTYEWISTFVDNALCNGISELYLLEHSHRFLEFKDAYEPICAYSEYQKNWYARRSGLSIDNYLRLIDSLKKESFPVSIKWGIEVCYLPKIKNIINDLDLHNKLDFLTGSIHWIDGWGFDHKKEHWNSKDINQVYKRYFDLEIELIESGLFDHIAHPDSIKCFDHYPTYNLDSIYDKIAKSSIGNGIKFEVSCGLKNNYGHERIGMEPSFLRILRSNNISLITASDAHKPEDVGRNIQEAEMLIIKSFD